MRRFNHLSRLALIALSTQGEPEQPPQFDYEAHRTEVLQWMNTSGIQPKLLALALDGKFFGCSATQVQGELFTAHHCVEGSATVNVWTKNEGWGPPMPASSFDRCTDCDFASHSEEPFPNEGTCVRPPESGEKIVMAHYDVREERMEVLWGEAGSHIPAGWFWSRGDVPVGNVFTWSKAFGVLNKPGSSGAAVWAQSDGCLLGVHVMGLSILSSRSIPIFQLAPPYRWTTGKNMLASGARI